MMCRILEVSRSGYYYWRSRPVNQRALIREEVRLAVLEAYFLFKRRYGAPRIAEELQANGIPCCKNHVAALLREAGLKAHNGRGFRYSIAGAVSRNVCDNILKRRFWASRPNEKWVSDITYIRVRSKWFYLSVVMDLYSRAIVGWSFDTHMTEVLICAAFDMAIARRSLEGDLMVHSDRGVQYRSNAYQNLLKENGCQISMSRKSNCWDNAAMESFFSRLKVELIYANKFSSFEQVKSAIFEYIEIFYNRQRRHSALGYISPMEFERINS